MDLFGKKAQAENVELQQNIKALEERLVGAKKLYEEKVEEYLKLQESKNYRIKNLEEEIDFLGENEKKLNKLLEEKTIEHTELYSKYKEMENMNNSNLEAAQTLQKDLEDYANTIRLQCDRIDAINTEKADLELQIKSLVASNKAKQIEIDRLKEDKDGKLYLDREKEEIKKLENIANNTKKGRIKSKNLKKSIDIRKNAIDRIQE